MGVQVQRILFISLFPPRVGGAPLQSQFLADNLEKEGFRVIRINVHMLHNAGSLVSRVKKTIMQPLTLLVQMIEAIRNTDHVHVAGCSYWGFMPVVVAVIVTRLWRKPLSLLYYGGAAADFISRHRIWVLPLLRRVDVVAVTSEYLKAIFGRYGIECRLIRPIGDFRGFRFVHRKRIRPILLSSRYLEPIYEVDTIVRAFRMVQSAIPPAKLIVAGSGSEQGELEDYVARHRLRVEFRGNVKFADMPALLKQADVYINAARVDNLPVSVIEAMYSGLLVITTPVGELRGLIDHGVHGLFFETSNAALLAKTIVFALRHQDLSLTCIRNAREKARGYAWPSLRDRYLDLFCSNVDRRSCRTPKRQDYSDGNHPGRVCSTRNDERDTVPEREMEG